LEGNFEYAQSRNLGLGGFVAYWSYRYGAEAYGFSADLRYVALGGTVNYHFGTGDASPWDPFIGAALGWYFVSASTSDSDVGGITEALSGMAIGGFVGARYFVTPSVALVGRLGLGLHYLSVGVDFRP
jgi:hypothetical protein